MFGRKKMYKKGLADAMQAYEAFGEKQKAALEHMRKEVQDGNKRLEDAIHDAVEALGGNIQGLYDHLNSKEKAALYQLNTPTDIKNLQEEEQRYLLAVLYQLADDEGEEVTSYQQAFIRSIRRYLGITNPQAWADLTAIENVDSIDSQKAILQVVLEFFYLRDNEEISDDQEEFLSYFSVNRKQAEAIEVRVGRFFNAMGAQGIAEKYGYVPEEEPKEVCETGDIMVETVGDAVVGNLLDADIEEAIADKIFRNVREKGCSNEGFVETENFILYNRRGNLFKMLDNDSSGIFAVNKTTGESKCVLPYSKFPQPQCCEIKKWLSHKDFVYAFFANERNCGPANVYKIDVLTENVTPMGFSIPEPRCPCATNGHYFVYTHDLGKLTCVDVCQKKKTPLLHKDHSNHDRVCTEEALYFIDWESQPKRLMEYSFEKRKERVVAEIPFEYGHKKMAYFDKTIFLVSQDRGLGWVDLATGQFTWAKTDEVLYFSKATVKKVSTGFLLGMCDSDYSLKYFDFATRKTETIATKCRVNSGGIFRSIYSIQLQLPNSDIDIYKIGEWVYFKRGEERVDAKVSLKRPMEVEMVSEPF